MSDYWEQFQDRSPDFWDGVRQGITAYAYWRDNIQVVGTMERPLSEVLAEVDEMAEKAKTDMIATFQMLVKRW